MGAACQARLARLKRSRKKEDRDLGDHIETRLRQKPRDGLQGKKPPPKHDTSWKAHAYRYWAARGGKTPGGLAPEDCPPGIEPGALLWWRLDGELSGGGDAVGYPTPQSISHVLDENWSTIEVWWRNYPVLVRPIGPGVSFPFPITLADIEGEDLRRGSKLLLRAIAGGRAEVRAEEMRRND